MYKVITMAESQSRFSIIEELTNQKATVDDKINDLLKTTENQELELKRWEKIVLNEREIRTENLKLGKEQRTREISTLKERKVELEKAIKAIENISKAEKE